jgi:23S rRNA (uracil1939-C5)-methyltransferase
MLAQIPGVVSVAAESGGRSLVFGESGLEYAVGDFRYRVSPGSFFQASRYLLPELVEAVTAGRSGRLALDLFAGVGLFTLPLARQFAQVISVEAAAQSAADLAANAKAHALGNVRAVAETTFDFLRRFAQAEPDLVVLDPPRSGVETRAVKFLTDCRPKQIHYVSCSPPTLARDLSFLFQRGYRIISIEMFDLFPQTYHIESLVRLTRSDLAGP